MAYLLAHSQYANWDVTDRYVEYEMEEVDRGGYDEISALGGEGFWFTHSHRGGADYCDAQAVCTGGEVFWHDTNSNGEEIAPVYYSTKDDEVRADPEVLRSSLGYFKALYEFDEKVYSRPNTQPAE